MVCEIVRVSCNERCLPLVGVPLDVQEGMMAFVKDSLGDADLVLMMTDVFEDPRDFPDQEIFAQMQQTKR